ncbi:MAG: UbiA family prenyltransferase [Desulfatitalea sp.]
MSSYPLVIDLDGTLLDSDLLIESTLAYVHAEPAHLLHPLGWLAKCGKAYLKERLANTIQIDVTRLPYNPEVVAFIKNERAKGRPIILATASHKIYAEQVATHLRLFDRVLATDGNINLSVRNKRNRLVEEFGEGGFDYVGNSHDDLPVWQAARRAYLVNPRFGLTPKAKAQGNVERIFLTPTHTIKIWAKTLRLHQWLKNLLLFVPLFTSHQIGQIGLLPKGIGAFFLFGLCASSAYLLNDLLDLANDRNHPIKRLRPLAAGLLPLKAGLLAFPVLLATALASALWLMPLPFTAALGIYYILTIAYSTFFKRLIVADVIILALLYTLRIIAGTFAFGLPLTYWMLAFSMFIFLSLALVKRYTELREARQNGQSGKSSGRGYYPDDLSMVASLGAAAGYLAVMVLALYIEDQLPLTFYSSPRILSLACPLLLYWISRVWLLTHRGQMHDDPVVFAIEDRASWIVGGLFGAIIWLAS